MVTTPTAAGQGFLAVHTELQTAANSRMPQQASALDSVRSVLTRHQVPGEAFARVSGSQTAATAHQGNVQDGATRLQDAVRRLEDWMTGVTGSDQAYQQNDEERAQQTEQVAQNDRPLPAGVPSWGSSGPPPDDGQAYSRAQIDDWIGQARQAMADHDGTTISDQDADRIAGLIQHESTNNPHAINLWDRNAHAGTPSKGLMQTIDPTFDVYLLPGHDNIWDPVDNIIAGTRYGLHEYHSIGQIPGVRATEHGRPYEGY